MTEGKGWNTFNKIMSQPPELPKCEVTYRYDFIDTKISEQRRRTKTLHGVQLEQFIIASPRNNRTIISITPIG